MTDRQTSTVHQVIDSKDSILQTIDSLDANVEAINTRVKDLVKKLEAGGNDKVSPEAMADM